MTTEELEQEAIQEYDKALGAATYTSIEPEKAYLPEPPEDDELSDFERKIEASRKILSDKGEFAGICETCFDTGFVHIEIDGYSGVQYVMSDGLMIAVKCSHGANIGTKYDF